ncbi:MAG: hypothetical protein ACLTT1_08755 [[Clostridium] scindens]
MLLSSVALTERTGSKLWMRISYSALGCRVYILAFCHNGRLKKQEGQKQKKYQEYTGGSLLPSKSRLFYNSPKIQESPQGLWKVPYHVWQK